MKLNIIIVFSIALTCCKQDNKTNTVETKGTQEIRDTTLVKKQNALNPSYELGFYSKSYSYNWTIGNDTLDLTINATEYEKDSTLHLNVFHKKPMLFKDLLDNINECLTLIKSDFDITKFSSIHFKSPIYYSDLTKELSKQYVQNFGRKNISYQKLNEFLLSSFLNTQLDNFLKPFDKKVKRYTIEKFHLLDKKYFNVYLPDIDLRDYPEFTIEGMGVSVQLDNK